MKSRSWIISHLLGEDKEEHLEWLIDIGKDHEAILYAACFVGCRSGVSRMLALAAPPHSDLRIATENSAVTVLRELLKHGADPDLGRKSLDPVIMTPAHITRCNVVAELLAAGATANLVDEQGRTALHLASNPLVEESAECLKILVAHGANVEATDKSGKTPLHKAAASGCPVLIATLLALGASPDAVDAGGSRPIDVAIRTRDRLQGEERIVGPPADWKLAVETLEKPS